MKNKAHTIPVAYDGWKFIFAFGLLGVLFLVLGLWFAKAVGAILILLSLFSVRFFRDGERDIPNTPDILAPADGTVVEVADINGEGYGKGRVVRIFLSVFDGHVQRSPVAGKVRELNYQPGLFLDARDPRAAFANESNSVEIDSLRGRIMVKQIAGLIARRIVCWVRPDDTLLAGERLGLIRFGSQVDLYVPMDVDITVREGMKVTAGQTIVGRWTDRAVPFVHQEAGPAGKPLVEAGV
jgi:phosphatidylserine decarboxylase